MGERNDNYTVNVDWPSVVPLGDTLAVKMSDGSDDQWVEAFEVVVGEHQRGRADKQWAGIDAEYTSDDEDADLVLYVRAIEPGARSADLSRTVDDLVQSANKVAQVGTHVYKLARELRQRGAVAPQETTGPRESTPPPIDPLLDELRVDAA